MANGVSVEIYSIGGGLKGELCDAVYETLQKEFGVEAGQVRGNRALVSVTIFLVFLGCCQIPEFGPRRIRNERQNLPLVVNNFRPIAVDITFHNLSFVCSIEGGTVYYAGKSRQVHADRHLRLH